MPVPVIDIIFHVILSHQHTSTSHVSYVATSQHITTQHDFTYSLASLLENKDLEMSKLGVRCLGRKMSESLRLHVHDRHTPTA